MEAQRQRVGRRGGRDKSGADWLVLLLLTCISRWRPAKAHVLANQCVAGKTTWWVLILLACNRQQRIDLHCTCYVEIKDSGMRSSECGMRSAEWGMRNAECGVRSAECGVRSGECGVRSAECGVGSSECGRRKAVGRRQEAECGVRSAEFGMRSAQCGVRKAESRGVIQINVEDHRQRGHTRGARLHGAGGNDVGRGYQAPRA
jgi:hypothetical protein